MARTALFVVLFLVVISTGLSQERRGGGGRGPPGRGGGRGPPGRGGGRGGRGRRPPDGQMWRCWNKGMTMQMITFGTDCLGEQYIKAVQECFEELSKDDQDAVPEPGAVGGDSPPPQPPPPPPNDEDGTPPPPPPEEDDDVNELDPEDIEEGAVDYEEGNGGGELEAAEDRRGGKRRGGRRFNVRYQGGYVVEDTGRKRYRYGRRRGCRTTGCMEKCVLKKLELLDATTEKVNEELLKNYLLENVGRNGNITENITKSFDNCVKVANCIADVDADSTSERANCRVYRRYNVCLAKSARKACFVNRGDQYWNNNGRPGRRQKQRRQKKRFRS